MSQFYKAYKIFHNLANDSSRQFEFMLNPVKVLTFNNWWLLYAHLSLQVIVNFAVATILVKILKVD